MKKIIAISVMFALIAGAAFGDVSFGGGLTYSTDLIKGKSGVDDVLAGGTNFGGANVDFNWSGENAGGKARFWSFPAHATPGWFNYFAYAWWKPIDQFKFQIGQNPDGEWGHAEIAGWGYNANAQDMVAIDENSGAGPLSKIAMGGNAGWWGGFSKLGLYLSVLPADGIEINLGIPLPKEDVASVAYMNSKFNVKVAIPDIGTVRLALDIQKANKDADVLVDPYFAFYLGAIENIGAEVSASFHDEFETIMIGLGFKLSAEDLTFKARIGIVTNDGNLAFGIGLLPSYNLGCFTFFFNAGFGMNPDAEKKDWFVNPYIQVPADMGNFYVGIKILDKGDEKVEWAIPIGWNVSF